MVWWLHSQKPCPDRPPSRCLLRTRRTRVTARSTRRRLIAGFGGNRKVLREVIDMFLVDGPALLAAVQRAWQTGDGPALASTAHALKGSVGLFVQAGAFETARQVERTARAGDLEQCGPLCASLEVDMKTLDSALRSLRRHLD